jgi:hypothetical protein
MAKFTLDDIRAEAERRYAPTVVELSDGTNCTLENILNLDDKTSNKVEKALKDLSATGEDDDKDVGSIRESATTLLTLIGGKNGAKLVEELDGNLARIMIVIEHWTSSTQVGEASPSGN